MKKTMLVSGWVCVALFAGALSAPAVATELTARNAVTEINAQLESFSVALALALEDPMLRAAIAEKAAERFDGDTEFLYNALANTPLGMGPTVHTSLRGHALRSGFSDATALDLFTASYPTLQIAVRVESGTWDPAAFQPLVTYWPVGKPDAEVQQLRAFDGQGKVHLLDAWGSSQEPVVVVGFSERTDAYGYLLPGFGPRLESACEEELRLNPRLDLACETGGGGGGGGGGTTCNTSATHTTGDPEILSTLLISDDHEPSWKGSPEIFARWVNPNSGLIQTADFPNVDNENQTYTLNHTLFNWTWPTPSSLGFVLEIWEDDNGILGVDGDDFVGSAYVAFSDTNCRSYQGGDATFSMKFE